MHGVPAIKRFQKDKNGGEKMTAGKTCGANGKGTFRGCDYFNANPWKLKYTCFQDDDSARCGGCPRTTWIKLLRRRTVEVTMPMLWSGGQIGRYDLDIDAERMGPGSERYPEGAKVYSDEITYNNCGYYEVTPWKMKYACFHSNEFMWCNGCPRTEGLKGFRKRRAEMRATGF